MNEMKISGARAKYFSLFMSKNIMAKTTENIKIQYKFKIPVNAEIAEINLTSPPPNEYGFLK